MLKYLKGRSVEGLVITGGMALNARLNGAVARRVRRPLHVPAAPHDAGLALGFLYAATPAAAPRPPPQLQFVGPRLKPAPTPLPAHAPADPAAVARALGTGAVVAVLRGRRSFLNRGLGHRAVLAAPVAGAAQRLHAMRHLPPTHWYVPLPLLVLATAVGSVCEGDVRAPHGLVMAPLTPKARAVCGLEAGRCMDAEGRAEVQTVAAGQDAFLEALLTERTRSSQLPALLHIALESEDTGLLVNSAEEAVGLLQKGLVDQVVLEDALVTREKIGGTRA